MSLLTSTATMIASSPSRPEDKTLYTTAVVSHSSSSLPSHPFLPSTFERLEIAPLNDSSTIEMQDAIEVVDSKYPYLESLESDVEFDHSPSTSHTKTAARSVIHLRSYLRGANLPELFRASATSCYADVLCPSGNPRNSLAILSSQKRMISQIRKFSREMFCKATKLYALENMYGPEDFVTLINTGVPACTPDEALTLHSYIGTSDLEPEEETPTRYPRNLPQLIDWIDHYPLRTLTRAIHLANPSTAGWWFERIAPQDLGGDFVKNRRTLAVLGWRFHPDQSSRPWFKEVDDEIGWVTSEEQGLDLLKVYPHGKPWFIPSPEVSIAIIIQPPWILSWEDLRDVANCKNLPQLTDPAADPSTYYTPAQRVWCQIRDACHKLKTKFFILTTYEGWLFGKFGGGRAGSGYIPASRSTSIRDYPTADSYDPYCQRMKIAPWAFDQWTYAETSELLEYKASNPSLMQFFYFWVARSMGLKKSRELPLELQLTDDEIATVERSTTYVPKEPPKWLPHYESYEFQHHTGNRPRPPRASSPRFAPYSTRPSRQPCKGTDTTSSTGLFAFIKSFGKYLSGTSIIGTT